MTLTLITRIESSNEQGLIAKLFGLKAKGHFTIVGETNEVPEWGDVIDENGVAWSSEQYGHTLSSGFNKSLYRVRLTTIRPQKELNVSMVFKRI